LKDYPPTSYRESPRPHATKADLVAADIEAGRLADIALLPARFLTINGLAGRLRVPEGPRLHSFSTSPPFAAVSLLMVLTSCFDPKLDDTGPTDCEPVTEIPYDGIDQDCDGSDLTDVDGDGADAQEVEGGTDCDDEDTAVNPAATEFCNGHDDDCDGEVDEADAADTLTWYADVDVDNYGDDATTTAACSPPSGYVEDNTDCDDSDALVNPAAEELHNGVDNDCDGLVDCEDGDLAHAPECEEQDCSDGLDDDHDGLVDCDDDDCWTLDCHQAGVRSRVHGGSMAQHEFGWRQYEAAWAAAVYWTRTVSNNTHSAQLDSVWGTLQVLPPGATSWEATSARSTCSWSVASASMTWFRRDYSHAHTGQLPAVNRAGVVVAEGCRVAGSWFLPAEVHPSQGVGWVDNNWLTNWTSNWNWDGGLPWYQGSITASSYWYSEYHGSGGSDRWGNRWTSFSESGTYQVNLRPEGTSWHVEP